MKPVITYHYRGQIERGNGKPGYTCYEGYSETIDNGISYPWMTYRECQRDAKAQGATARFARVYSISQPDRGNA